MHMKQKKFLIHRVELKELCPGSLDNSGIEVSNSPCGVERHLQVLPYGLLHSKFLIHRVELKAVFS